MLAPEVVAAENAVMGLVGAETTECQGGCGADGSRRPEGGPVRVGAPLRARSMRARSDADAATTNPARERTAGPV